MDEDNSARFSFGDNWKRFLATIDESRIVAAQQSLLAHLDLQSLEGLSFLDIGSGSGLFSLAAARLGAKRIHSFDYDLESVACTAELRRRFASTDDRWKVESGSVLDEQYMASLGQFDIVYSWGVLHHTGSMWTALDAACRAVASDGRLYVALYNDQGGGSRRWLRIKRLYNSTPRPIPTLLVLGVGAILESRTALVKLARRQNPIPGLLYGSVDRPRGMSRWHDLVDWVGGYPFEVARPELVFEFCQERGFALQHLATVAGGHACNEYVFSRQPQPGLTVRGQATELAGGEDGTAGP